MSKIKDTDIIELNHGGGGRKMDELIHFITLIISDQDENDVIGPEAMDDSAVLDFSTNRVVMTTDSHTVEPIFFQGGNLGNLSIAGTVNDIAVMGAQPLYLSLGMVIEEGFLFGDLRKICESIRNEVDQSGVRIVCGDTKVMPRGSISGLITNTAGIGKMIRKTPLQDRKALVDDVIIVSGPIGDHGSSIMAQREGIKLETALESDVAAIWPEFKSILEHSAVHSMKDITRGGLSSALNEIASKSNICIEVDETVIPIREEVKAICEILGLEPLEISCEGRVVLTVTADQSEGILNILQSTKLGAESRIIGRVLSQPEKRVHVKTEIGGTRILLKPYGEPIPRVC